VVPLRHFPKIGKDALGSQIVDYAYDAYQCRALANSANPDDRAKTLNNADTYVWYALASSLYLILHLISYVALVTNIVLAVAYRAR
jgi:hypothetical protein